MKTVLERANTLADRVLGVGTECWMIANSYPDHLEESAKYFPGQRLIRDIFGLQKSYSWKVPIEAPADQIVWTTYAGEFLWRHGEFDEAIKIIAEDIETDVLWVSKKTKAVFAPYDGGTDLVAHDSREIASLKDGFSNWLSDRPDGL